MTRSLAAMFAVALACSTEPAAPPPADARPRADASLHDAAAGIACRGAECSLGQTCCREILTTQPPQPIHFCVPTEPLCDFVSFGCDGPEDCGDGVCCEQVDGVRCATETEPCRVIVCHKDSHCRRGEQCCDNSVGVVKTCKLGC